MKVKNNSTLSDKIAGILNSAPSNFDPEDDSVDNTNAKTLEDVEDSQEEEEEVLSTFRRANVDLLADLDDKYSGKKTSRKYLKDSDSDELNEAYDSGDGGSESEDSETSFNNKLEDGLNSEDVSSDDNGSEDEEGSEESEFDGDLQENEYSEEDNFKHITDGNNVSNQNKGVHVRNQTAMWEHLLEIRIQLQRCLITANKMPHNETFAEIKKGSGSEFSNKVNETQIKLGDTLDKLLELQRLLLRQYPETKNLKEEGFSSNKCDGDEEIESDSNEESDQEEESEGVKAPKRKRRKLQEYEPDLSEHHKVYGDYRNRVIQKWSDKTQIGLKGGATSHSILDQIKYNLNNKDKLIVKTQLKRSQYTVLGEKIKEDDKVKEQYSPEIFDDDDFYHQLLRELIAVKSADVTDPVQLGRQWIQLQNVRNKMKRKVDTRATKGRKIRYAVHSKLVNFMGPIDQNLWTDEAKNELFNSLFSRNQTI